VHVLDFPEQDREYSYRKKGIKVEELKVLGVSPYKAVLNNDFFTTVDMPREGQRKDRSLYTYFDDVRVSIVTEDRWSDKGVFLSIYSTKPPSNKILKKMYAEMSLEIDKKYAFLFGGIKDKIWDLIEEHKF